MSDFRIKESVLNVQFGYENEQMFIDGQYSVNQTEGTLLQVSGQCYIKEQDGKRGNNIGNFNGYQRNGQMKYTTSEMLPEYGTAVYNAIADLESKITPANEGEPSEEE